jgi:hypothetical protein
MRLFQLAEQSCVRPARRHPHRRHPGQPATQAKAGRWGSPPGTSGWQSSISIAAGASMRPAYLRQPTRGARKRSGWIPDSRSGGWPVPKWRTGPGSGSLEPLRAPVVGMRKLSRANQMNSQNE